jgi:hypothetical protein
MKQHIIIRKCWSCHNALLNSEQIKNDKPCFACQKKGIGPRPKARQKKVIRSVSYEDIKSRLHDEQVAHPRHPDDN